jgi:hypothetical protein
MFFRTGIAFPFSFFHRVVFTTPALLISFSYFLMSLRPRCFAPASRFPFPVFPAVPPLGPIDPLSGTRTPLNVLFDEY